MPSASHPSVYRHYERLALQSCKLQFLDPDEIVLKDGTTKLTEGWWTKNTNGRFGEGVERQ